MFVHYKRPLHNQGRFIQFFQDTEFSADYLLDSREGTQEASRKGLHHQRHAERDCREAQPLAAACVSRAHGVHGRESGAWDFYFRLSQAHTAKQPGALQGGPAFALLTQPAPLEAIH